MKEQVSNEVKVLVKMFCGECTELWVNRLEELHRYEILRHMKLIPTCSYKVQYIYFIS